MQEIVMPKLGLTMKTGTVVQWLKKEGDAVKAGEPVVSVETEKYAVDVEAPQAGILHKILVPEGEERPVGEPLGLIGEPGAQLPETNQPSATVAETPTPSPTSAPAPAAPAPAAAPAAGQASPARPASPLARKLAREHGIDLAVVNGTGPGGRITEKDILAAVEARSAAPAGAGSAPGELPPVVRTVPVRGIRKVIAERMTQSWTEVPHVRLTITVDADPLVAFRETLRSQGITVSDLLVRATALALMEHSDLNAEYTPEEIKVYGDVNIGMAVDAPQGLVVPVIRSATRSLAALAQDRKALVEKARNRTLGAEELSGGTFTISNLGMLGIEDFTAIVNPPQAAILAVGALSRRPVVVGHDALAVRWQMTLSLSLDHRVADGAAGARFLATLKKLLEAPEGLANG